MATCSKGRPEWKKVEVARAATPSAGTPGSTYIAHPPYFDNMPKEPGPLTDIVMARELAILGDSITTDHISPAGSIKKDGPAGEYLLEHQVRPAEFNSYGSRRGNHEVMMRGTFANIRIRNEMVPGIEGGMTKHLPDGKVMPIYDAAMLYQKEGVPLVIVAGKEYGIGLVARLGGQGHAAPGRARGDRRELRAHPSLEPRRHGRAAAAIQARHDPPDA